MGNKKSIGLPGGPNEFLQDITQYISVDGYRRDSDDKTNPVNFIPSGDISMKDVDFPIMGTDNLGNSQMMFPENEYQFPGDMVMEVPEKQLGGLVKLLKAGIKQAPKYMDDVTKNAYKYNPWAYNNIDSKLPEILQFNRENDSWLRQVGRPAIDDVKETGVVREMNEVISPKLFDEKVKALQNQQTGINFSLDKRYPGPFFKKGETFFDMNKVSKNRKLDGLRNTRGKSGSAEYLIETGPSIGDDLFQPAYMQKMFTDFAEKGTGDVAIMKPFSREASNFNFYKKDWWDGYKRTPLNELQAGGGLAGSLYKLATDDDYKWTDALYDNTLAPLSHALDVVSIPGALIGELGESISGRGDGEFNFTDAMPGFKGDYSFENMNGTEFKNLAGIKDKDGNPLVENELGAFALNVLTDPSTYIGAGAIKSVLKKGISKSAPLVKNIVAKSTDDIVKAGADDMVEVFTSDGSKKLMKKADAIRLNRIEDANVNNKTFTNYEDGNWFSDEIQPFYLNNAKNTLKGGLLNPTDPKRVMSAYLDPADAKLFNVSQQGTTTAKTMSGGAGNLPLKGEYVLPPALVKTMREGTSGPGFNTMIGNSESIMNNLDAFYKKLGGGVYQEGGGWRDINVNIEGVKKAIAQAESLGGKLMKNTESTASGLYGQRFSELDKYDLYDGTRDEFIADKDAQERIFNMRLNEGLVSKKGDTITTPLLKDAYDLTIEYKDQLGDDWDYSYEDIINLSNFIGRGGTRKYFGDVIRDGKKLEDVYPELFGPNAKQSNKTPQEYLKISREYYQGGGEKALEEMTQAELKNKLKNISEFGEEAAGMTPTEINELRNVKEGFNGTPENEEFKYNNWTRGDGTVEPKTLYEKAPTKLRMIEEDIDKYLGNPAQTAFDLYPGIDIKDDARRHAYASALTASKTSPLIANMLGFGHEFGAKNLGSEHLKDVGNNFIGSIVGGVPFVDDTQRKQMIEWLSDNGLLFKEGGSLPKGQYGNREVFEAKVDNTGVATRKFDILPDLGFVKNPIVEPKMNNPFGSYAAFDPSEFEVAQDNTYVDTTKYDIRDKQYLKRLQRDNPSMSIEEIEKLLQDSMELNLFDDYEDPVLIADFIKKSNYYAEGWKDMEGASEEEVKDLQEVLLSKGYNIGQTGVDGNYGNRTYGAHRAMVDDSNLDPTAISRYYKKYSKDTYDEVKSIQNMLITKGYMDPLLANKKGSSIDGKFGDQTKNALDAFNTDNFEEDPKATVFNNIPSSLDEPRCAAGMCNILEGNGVLTEAIGVKYKDAWDLFESMEGADNSTSIYNIYDSKLFDNVNENTPIELLKNITGKAKKKLQTKASDYKIGDIVGLYWQGSSHHSETLNSKTHNTHSGFVSNIVDGVPIITHNVNGRVIQQPYSELTTAWIRRPNEDVKVRSKYEITDEINDMGNDELAIINLETKYNSQLSDERKAVVRNILKRATYNSNKIPEILNSSVDPEWLKSATFGITGVESGVGFNAPRTVEEARSVNSGLQGIAYDIAGKEESGISLGVGKTKFASLDKFARQYFDITSPEDLADDNKAVDAVSYILTKNYELFKDYAKQYPTLGLTEQDIRNMAILSYNQGSNRLIGTGRVDDDRSPEEEIAALRDLYEGTSPDISSTKYRFGNKLIDGLGDGLYNSALALGLEKPGEQYISKVNGYIQDIFPQSIAMADVDPFQVTTMAQGGEYGVFKNYIKGDYDGTKREVYAKGLYDKLNRKHYRQAKLAGMSPANYIMTNLVDNS